MSAAQPHDGARVTADEAVAASGTAPDAAEPRTRLQEVRSLTAQLGGPSQAKTGKGRGVAAARPALPTESATADDGGGGRPARDGRARGGGRPAGGDRARGRGRPRFAAGDDGGGERPPETEEETGWLKVVAPKDEAGREFAVGDDGGGGRSWTSGCT